MWDMSNALIIPREIATSLTGEACSSCRFSHTDETSDLVCRKHPPQVTVLLVPAPPPRVGMMPAPFCTFPIVRADYWCGDWESLR